MSDSTGQSWKKFITKYSKVARLILTNIIISSATFFAIFELIISEEYKTSRLNLSQQHSQKLAGLEKKYNVFENLIEVDQKEINLLLEMNNDNNIKLSKILSTERKKRICFAVAIGLIEIEPYIFKDINNNSAEYLENNYAKDLKKFINEKFQCNDEDGYVPNSYHAHYSDKNDTESQSAEVEFKISQWQVVIASYSEDSCNTAKTDFDAFFQQFNASTIFKNKHIYIARTKISNNYAIAINAGENYKEANKIKNEVRSANKKIGKDAFVQINKDWFIDLECNHSKKFTS